MNPKILTDLRKILATLYPDSDSIGRIGYDSGIDRSRIVFNTTAINIWQSILTEAEKMNRVEALFDIVENEYSGNQELQSACHAYRQSIGKPDHPHAPSGTKGQVKFGQRRLLALLLGLLLIGIVGSGWYWGIFNPTGGRPVATPTVIASATAESTIASVILTPTEPSMATAIDIPLATTTNPSTLSALATAPLTITSTPLTTSTSSESPQTTATITTTPDTPGDLRVLDKGLTDNTYLIEGVSHAQFAVGADLVAYGEPNPGTEVAIALLKVIGQSPNSLTAQTLLIDPENAIRTRMRVDDQITFLAQSRLVPVFAYADGYLLRPTRIRLRPDHALTVGAQLQALEFERINGEIIDALRTDTIMQIAKIGENNVVAVVDLITGTWPITGTIVALVEVPAPLPSPTATDLPTATARAEPTATSTPIAANQVRIVVTGIGAAPADVTSPGIKKQYALTAAKAVASANFARWQNGEAVEEVMIVNQSVGELLEDAIRIEVQRARIPGGTVIEQIYDDANGEATVTVEYVVEVPQ